MERQEDFRRRVVGFLDAFIALSVESGEARFNLALAVGLQCLRLVHRCLKSGNRRCIRRGDIQKSAGTGQHLADDGRRQTARTIGDGKHGAHALTADENLLAVLCRQIDKRIDDGRRIVGSAVPILAPRHQRQIDRKPGFRDIDGEVFQTGRVVNAVLPMHKDQGERTRRLIDLVAQRVTARRRQRGGPSQADPSRDAQQRYQCPNAISHFLTTGPRVDLCRFSPPSPRPARTRRPSCAACRACTLHPRTGSPGAACSDCPTSPGLPDAMRGYRRIWAGSHDR